MRCRPGTERAKDHAFLGTEAITIDAWNPTTGGLSFEGKFKFSGDGTGNQSALNQAGMILGFFSYEKTPRDHHTEIDFEVFTSNLKDPALNQISTNVFNGSRILTIHDPVHNRNVNIDYDPLSYPNNPLPNAEYHTYRFEWFPNWVNFYIDNKLLRTVTNPELGSGSKQGPATSPQHLGPIHEHRSCQRRLEREQCGRSLARAGNERCCSQDLLR